MGSEIERKFLVIDDAYKQDAKVTHIRQGYLCTSVESVVRVRIYGDKGYLTIKGKQENYTRKEFEYEIPFSDAYQMLEGLCAGTQIEKNRYELLFEQKLWIVDEFLGDNEGLILAEVELDDEDEKISIPKWIGEEVTLDFKYSNSELSKNSYKKWAK